MVTRWLPKLLPWLLRAGWILVLVFGGAALDDASASRSISTPAVVEWSALAMWVAGVAAMAIPAVASLTAVRLIVPLAIPSACVAIIAGAEDLSGWAFLIAALLSTIASASAITGRVFVQASAYGEEDRYPLRPPAAYLLAAGLAWALTATALLSASVIAASQRWWIAAVLAGLGVALAAFGWQRWHRLSRRWFVIVPIGVVIHDQLVLAETIMLRRQEIARLRLAPAGTEAADLTGPSAGHAVEVSTHESITAVFAGRPGTSGRAIHLTAMLVAPSRPGAALEAAAARRLPVG